MTARPRRPWWECALCPTGRQHEDTREQAGVALAKHLREEHP